jgi:hypothetical protein
MPPLCKQGSPSQFPSQLFKFAYVRQRPAVKDPRRKHVCGRSRQGYSELESELGSRPRGFESRILRAAHPPPLASATATAAMPIWTTMSIRRQSRTSARAPAGWPAKARASWWQFGAGRPARACQTPRSGTMGPYRLGPRSRRVRTPWQSKASGRRDGVRVPMLRIPPPRPERSRSLDGTTTLCGTHMPIRQTKRSRRHTPAPYQPR